jgi:hypothetical protein
MPDPSLPYLEEIGNDVCQIYMNHIGQVESHFRLQLLWHYLKTTRVEMQRPFCDFEEKHTMMNAQNSDVSTIHHLEQHL